MYAYAQTMFGHGCCSIRLSRSCPALDESIYSPHAAMMMKCKARCRGGSMTGLAATKRISMLREGNRSIGLQASMIGARERRRTQRAEARESRPPSARQAQGCLGSCSRPNVQDVPLCLPEMPAAIGSPLYRSKRATHVLEAYRKWMLPQVFRNANIRFATSDHLTSRKTARPFSARQTNG